MAKYGTTSKRKVKRAMHEFKHGQLTSGHSGRKVKSRKQAIAIGLSEARRSGAKVPKKPASKSTSRKRSSRKRSGARKSSSRRGSRTSSRKK